MRQPDNELRQQIEIAIASAQNVPFVGPNQQRIARSLLPLIAATRTAALEEAVAIVKGNLGRIWIATETLGDIAAAILQLAKDGAQ